jgi:hypothetical protein
MMQIGGLLWSDEVDASRLGCRTFMWHPAQQPSEVDGYNFGAEACSKL